MAEPNSFSSTDDIPEAKRDSGPAKKSSVPLRRFPLWIFWFFLGLLSALAGLIFSLATYPSTESITAITFQPLVQFPTVDTPISTSGTTQREPNKSLLGHFAYEEAPVSELVALSYDASIRLRGAAAQQFEAMLAAATAQGIYLVPLSGFRSVEDQEYLFFDIKAERGQSATTRAEVSAPPGYSEHHTGYAIDIGDANYPDTHLQVNFETTPAFQWLARNAARYSFELSFPEGNPQGIQYEPWHWRFVGDPDSLETFYQDR